MKTNKIQKARSFACDDDVWKKCFERAQERKLTVSAYIRNLIEDDIKQRKLRLGHANGLVGVRIKERAELI